jgi:hypothetical protein
MNLVVTHNKVKVTDRVKALEVCNNFEFWGGGFYPDEQGILEYLEYEHLADCQRWPSALSKDQMPDKHTSADDDEDTSEDDDIGYSGELFDAFSDHGDDGFNSFLIAIAPLLEESLTILAVECDCDARAKVWHVEPNGKLRVLDAFTG